MLLRHKWRSNPRMVFGSGGSHGPVELGGLAYVLGGFSDEVARRWLAEKPRTLVGISVGCVGAIGMGMGMGVMRLAALYRIFPMAETFGRDLALGGIAGGEAGLNLKTLMGLRGLLKGCSLRTVVHVLLRMGGVEDDDITLRQYRERFGTDLRMIVTNLSTLRPCMLSAEETPEVRVMDAAVASMSIPLMFEPVRIPGVGDCVDGGVADPYGMMVEPQGTLWLCKEIHLHEDRRADSLVSVMCGCFAAVATATQDFAGRARLSRLNFLPLHVGARHGCDERDVSSAVDLFSSNDPSGMILDGMECAEATVLCAWMALACAAKKGRAQRSAASSCEVTVTGERESASTV